MTTLTPPISAPAQRDPFDLVPTGLVVGRSVLHHVLAYPEAHNQDTSACGTTACLAGWAVIAATADLPEVGANAEDLLLAGWHFLSPNAEASIADTAFRLLTGVTPASDPDLYVRFYTDVFVEFDETLAIKNFEGFIEAHATR